MSKVLILGKMPPPVGGVTIHVRRLVDNLHKMNYRNFTFCDLNEPAKTILWKLVRHRAIHLHTSNCPMQLAFALFAWLLNKKLLITYHGNWGRYGIYKNFMVRLSARLAYLPIVQNEGSLQNARRVHKRAMLVSSFIPPVHAVPLNDYTLQKITEFKTRFKYIWCTNAWNLTFDRDGKETYGIIEIIRVIETTLRSGLIISDPSGNYHAYIELHFGKLPRRILLLTGIHDFTNVLRLSDGFIRNTTTDGDSMSIHEALHCRSFVLATNVVSRPHGCRLYNNLNDINIEAELEKVWNQETVQEVKEADFNAMKELLAAYERCLV